MTAASLFILGAMFLSVVWPDKNADPRGCARSESARGERESCPLHSRSPRPVPDRWELIGEGIRAGWEAQGRTRHWK